MQPPENVMAAAAIGQQTQPNHHLEPSDSEAYYESTPTNNNTTGSTTTGLESIDPQSGRNSLLRTCIVMLLSITIVLVIIDAQTTKYLEMFYTALMDWLSSHLLLGIFVIILLYILATILFIPGSILTIGTGYAFHQALQQQQYSNAVLLAVVCSSVAVFVGATLGSILCFLLGRYMFRDYAIQMANRYEIFCAIDRGTLH